MAIITINRGTYTGGKELAERLSDDLGYDLLCREELLERTAEMFSASQDQLSSALAQKPSFLEGRGLRKRQYLHCVQAAMASFVLKDNTVYHGQAGHLLLGKLAHHMRIRVVADMEFRIRVTIEAGTPSREKAIEDIAQLDRKRSGWMKWVHGVDINDPTSYDMVVNLERMPIPVVSSIVCEAVSVHFQTTPESLQEAEDLALSSELRARLGLNKDILEDRLNIEAHKGAVSIAANVRSLADAERAKEFVSKIDGVKSVEVRVGTRW